MLSGKTALVTGASGGIGRAIAAALRGAGSAVLGADLPGRGADLQGDLGDPEAARLLFEEFDRRSGGLDVAVHAAGIARDAVLWKLTDDDWSAVLRANLDSSFHVLREAVPRMRARGGGSIVLVASINGERGKRGQANYAASKAGVIALCRTAAREAGRFGIRVNAVAPGLIETPMTAGLPPEVLQQAREETVLGKLGTPEDVAQAVLFLASPAAGHVTGQVLRVDGGQLIG